MNFDRNTVIGFVVLALLFFGYFYFNNQEQAAYQKEKARQDSIARAALPKQDTAAVRTDSLRSDSANRMAAAGGFEQALAGTEQTVPVENDLMRVIFTNRGGQIKSVELKNFKGPDSTPVRLAATDFDRINYAFNSAPNRTAEAAAFYFSGGTVSRDAGNVQTITYRLQSADGQSLVHQFVIRPGQYMLDFNLQVNGVNQLFTGQTLNLTWQNAARQLQKDLSYEKQQSQICYNSEGDYDDYNILSDNDAQFEEPVKWVAVKQQFFNTALFAKNAFASGRIDWSTPENNAAGQAGTVVQAIASLKVPLGNTQSANVPMSIYFGPNDYKILKDYGHEMENMVNLGSGIFAFVKYINRWIVIPAFHLFEKVTLNYGIVILLLTLFIRLLISPLTYSSYLSGAKMKALRPEIEQLRAKYGSDQQAMSMEQMKLFREAGVNPLGGCLPALLQIPIFFALYSFFNSNVALRGQGFLWADDLSQYDSIATLPFSIPFYGDHVSLFTITAVLTSFLISIYSMSMTPDQNNPVLKWMPYIFPFILLFVFNSLPAGLTWYYTVSNLITLALQFVIQHYIINHDKILAKIEENRKKPKKVSKWQERMAEMQEQQKKLKEMQEKGRR